MAIPAVRFDNLTTDFNIASKSFNSIVDSGVLNTPEASIISDTIESAKDLLSQLKELDTDQLSDVKDYIKDATRATQNVYNTFVDIAKLPGETLNNLLDGILPDDLGSMKNAIKNMTSACKNNALGAGLGFGKVSFGNCGDVPNVGSCPPNQAGKVLGGALANGVNSLLNSAKNLLGKIMSLANIGFNANLCGVFSALIDGLTDLPLIGTAAALLTNQQGSKGNLNAVFDITKSVSALDINVASIIPGTVSNVVTGVGSLQGLGQNKLNDVWNSLGSSLETLDKNWLTSGDGYASVEKLTTASQSVRDMVSNAISNEDTNLSSLNTVPNTNPALIALQLV